MGFLKIQDTSCILLFLDPSYRNIHMDTKALHKKNIEEMITVAVEYCHFVESAHKYKVEEVHAYLQKVLPLLYLKGAMLPQHIVVNNPEANERFVTAETYDIIYSEMKEKWGADDVFWAYDADNENKEVEKMSMAEQLSDMYQDLKDFVLLYAKGTQAAQENAAANCRLYYDTHWGPRCLRLLHEVHRHMVKPNNASEII